MEQFAKDFQSLKGQAGFNPKVLDLPGGGTLILKKKQAKLEARQGRQGTKKEDWMAFGDLRAKLRNGRFQGRGTKKATSLKRFQATFFGRVPPSFQYSEEICQEY